MSNAQELTAGSTPIVKNVGQRLCTNILNELIDMVFHSFAETEGDQESQSTPIIK